MRFVRNHINPTNMRHLFTIFLLFAFSNIQAQFLLNLDGEAPNPFTDKSGNNTVTEVGSPLNTNGAIEFPTGDDYLIIDPFVVFELDADWTVSFDINMSDPTDSVYVIDWRSNSNTGHMHIGYTGERGMYFSDRNINGLYGNLVEDPVALPANQWVHFDVAREGDSLFISRDGNQVGSAYFVDNLSPLSTTTIGYSEDFRYNHDPFLLDNVTLTADPVASVTEMNAFDFVLYPNPATNNLNVSTTEDLVQITVYNAIGKQVLRYSPNSKMIDISTLRSGLYFVELRSESGVSIERIIKR